MVSRVVLSLAALGVVVGLAASHARTIDTAPMAAAAAEAPIVVASAAERALMRPATPVHADDRGPADAGSANATAGDTEPKNWVLVAAGVYLIGTVLRRRARSMTI